MLIIVGSMSHGLAAVMPEWHALAFGPPPTPIGKNPLVGSIGQTQRPLLSGTAISKARSALASALRQPFWQSAPRTLRSSAFVIEGRAILASKERSSIGCFAIREDDQ